MIIKIIQKNAKKILLIGSNKKAHSIAGSGLLPFMTTSA